MAQDAGSGPPARRPSSAPRSGLFSEPGVPRPFPADQIPATPPGAERLPAPLIVAIILIGMVALIGISLALFSYLLPFLSGRRDGGQAATAAGSRIQRPAETPGSEDSLLRGSCRGRGSYAVFF